MTETIATITGGAKVHATQNILVQSDDGTTATALAGPAVFAGVANIGLGLSSEAVTKQTLATIDGGSLITADGVGSGLELSGTSVHGLAVLATGHSTLADAAGAAGSSGVAGFAGSATLHKLDETTHATIGGNATVNAGANGNQTVHVYAKNDTVIVGFGGAVQNSGADGAGGGLDGGQITKDTQAAIHVASVNSNRNVQVLALSSEHVQSISGSLGMSGAVAVAGAAAGYELPVTTEAIIGAGASVSTPGSIVVNADDQVDVNVVAGELSASQGSPAAGAAAGLVVLDKNTLAVIDSGAIVTALGTLPAITTNSGLFNITYQPDAARIPGMVAAGILRSSASFSRTRSATQSPTHSTSRAISIFWTSRPSAHRRLIRICRTSERRRPRQSKSKVWRLSPRRAITCRRWPSALAPAACYCRNSQPRRW